MLVFPLTETWWARETLACGMQSRVFVEWRSISMAT